MRINKWISVVAYTWRWSMHRNWQWKLCTESYCLLHNVRVTLVILLSLWLWVILVLIWNRFICLIKIIIQKCILWYINKLMWNKFNDCLIVKTRLNNLVQYNSVLNWGEKKSKTFEIINFLEVRPFLNF